VTLDATLDSIATSGALYVLGGRNFTAVANSGNFADSGLLDIGGGTVTATSIALNGTGTIAGFGTVKASETGKGALRATGGTLDFSAGTIGFLTNTTLASGDILEADAAATLKLSNNKTIAVDSGIITLSGTNSVIESLNTGTNTEIQIDSTIDDVAAGGAFNLLAGRSFTAKANAGSFTNAGKISLGGGTFTATRLTEATGALLSGFGTVAGPISNAGTIIASGGTLALTGALSGAGTLSAAAGATLKLSLGGPFSEPIIGAGTLELSGTTAYTLAGTLAVGTVKIDAGTSLSGSGTIQGNLADAGAVTASTGTLGIGGSVTGAGTLSAASGAVLDLKGGGSFTGALTGAGKIQIDSALTLNAGTSLSATSVLDNANVTLGAGAAITNAATHSYKIAAAANTTLTVGGAGTFTNDGTLAATGAGTVDIDTTFINAASVSVGSGKMVFLNPVSGAGTVSIASGATAAFEAGAAATQNLSFLGTIIGFTGADKIDLLNTAATKLTYSGNQLKVLNGTTTVATLTFSGAYTSNNFVLGSDNSGGSLITWQS
jgi:fibronectin-binding autotransporter adhesin